MSLRNSTISQEVYEKALKESWKVTIDLENIFPDAIKNYLMKKSIELGVPFMYIAYPFLTGISHTLGRSVVEVTSTYLEPVILYTLVSGRSGTNKSGSLSLIKRFIDSLPTEKVTTFDSGTLEGLLSALIQNDGCLLSMVDEFTTFLDSLDKNTNGNAERARYLSLWSGSDWSKRTKNGGLECINSPRYNFTGFNQNYFLINLILNSNHYDGFLQRFLVATPAEVYVPLKEKVDASKEIDPIDMCKLFKINHDIFSNGITFKMSDAAMALFENYHDNEVLMRRKADQFEGIKSSILTKSIGNALRVAALQCALNVSLKMYETINQNEDAMTQTALEECDYTISGDDMKRSINIVSYSVNCLFSLLDSTNESKRLGLKRPLTEMPAVENIDTEFLYKYCGKIQKLFAHIEGETKSIPVSKITKNHIYPQIGNKSSGENARTFLSALEKYGIGKYSVDKKEFLLTEKENIDSPEKIKLFNRLGIYL